MHSVVSNCIRRSCPPSHEFPDSRRPVSAVVWIWFALSVKGKQTNIRMGDILRTRSVNSIVRHTPSRSSVPIAVSSIRARRELPARYGRVLSTYNGEPELTRDNRDESLLLSFREKILLSSSVAARIARFSLLCSALPPSSTVEVFRVNMKGASEVAS